jgi:hypothetical protein
LRRESNTSHFPSSTGTSLVLDPEKRSPILYYSTKMGRFLSSRPSYKNKGIDSHPTQSESVEEEMQQLSEDEEEASSTQSSIDSGPLGLQIPAAYLLSSTNSPNKSKSKYAAPLTQHTKSGETDGDIQRLIMLAKHPTATEEQVADAIFRQQQAQASKIKKSQKQQQHVAFRSRGNFPIDSDTGEAWDRQQRQQQGDTVNGKGNGKGKGNNGATSFASSLQVRVGRRRPQDPENCLDQACSNDPQSRCASAEQCPEPEPKHSFLLEFWRRFFPHADDTVEASVEDDCGASKEANSLSISMSSEKTPKISNVDPRARAKRIRNGNGHYTFCDQLAEGWKRLTATRNGIIVLSLLFILILAIVVTIAAAVASANKQDQNINKNVAATMIPRPPDMGDGTDTDTDTNYTIAFQTTTPSMASSPAPSATPVPAPTDIPAVPTPRPSTQAPTVMLAPSSLPTPRPTKRLTPRPTAAPTRKITSGPTIIPNTSSPTVAPITSSPTALPTADFLTSPLEAVGAALLGSEPEQRFGHSVALSDDGQIMAVGAPFATIDGNSQAGMVQVYEWRNDQWVTRGPALVGRHPKDQLGSTVALSHDGSILVASEPTFDGESGDRSGNVRAFVYAPTNRYEALGQELEGDAATDYFGISIALSTDGRRLAVGAPYHDNGSYTSRKVSGQVTVFDFVDNVWTPLNSPLEGTDPLDWFGWTLDLSEDGSVLCVGAPRNDGGYVNCYQLDDNIMMQNWVLMGNSIRNAIDPQRYDDNFGHSLKLSGNRRIAIGAPGKNVQALDAGLVAVYEFDIGTGQWTLLGSPIIDSSDTPGDGQQLGFGVDLRDDVLVVGTPGKDNRGQVDLYQLKAGEWEPRPTSLQGAEGSNFGFSVRWTGAFLAIGSAVTSDQNTGMVTVYSII